MYFLLNLSHVTQEANFEKILFFPNSGFNIRKSHKISSRKALYFRSYQPKSSTEMENTPPPPVLLGLNVSCFETVLEFKNNSSFISTRVYEFQVYLTVEDEVSSFFTTPHTVAILSCFSLMPKQWIS